jgi:hypothetical protein
MPLSSGLPRRKVDDEPVRKIKMITSPGSERGIAVGKSKKRRSSGSRRQQSTLAQHRRQGKTFTPPLRSLPGPLHEIPWLRDVFPDMLWMCAVLVNLGERRGISACTEVLDRLAPLIPASETDEERPVEFLTGSLTSFDLIPVDRRREASTC